MTYHQENRQPLSSPSTGSVSCLDTVVQGSVEQNSTERRSRVATKQGGKAAKAVELSEAQKWDGITQGQAKPGHARLGQANKRERCPGRNEPTLV